MENFQNTGLRAEIVRAVSELGYEKPTPIQEKVIPIIIESERDLVALAQTGTGKTAAFGLPLIEKINPASRHVQALILSPTRELAIQIHGDFASYAKYIRGLNTVAVYGGANISEQIRAIRRDAHIIVGTPGRVLDLIRRQVLDLSSIGWLVLDEADEMLNMGFQQDIDAILATSPKEKQTLLFSATMPKEIARIARKYMHDPDEIAVGERNAGAKNVQHEYYMVQARDRYEALKRIADINPDIYGIIFCRTRRDTTDLARKLNHDGYHTAAINGDLSQAQRDHVMEQFRSRQIQLLVATDVAARGIDVDDLTHVINYQIPDELEVYIHRSGRTGRAGKEGISISIVHSRESRQIRALENMVGKKFERKLVPNGEEICEKRLYEVAKKLDNVEVNEKQIRSFLPAIEKQLEHLTKEELIKKFVSFEFNQYLDYYKDAPDLNINTNDRERSSGRSSSRQQQNFTRLYINLGAKHEIHAARLMGMINELLPNKRIRIGKIDIMRKFSFFEVEDRFAGNVAKAFNGTYFEEIPIAVEKANPESGMLPQKGKAESKDNKFDKKKNRKRRQKRARQG